MLGEFWEEDTKETLKLVHFDLKNLELVDKELVEVRVHHAFEDRVRLDLVAGFNEEIASNVVHALTI